MGFYLVLEIFFLSLLITHVCIQMGGIDIFLFGVHLFLPSNASNDSDDESTFNDQSYLMDEVRIVEGALCELTHEHHLEDKVFFCF